MKKTITQMADKLLPVVIDGIVKKVLAVAAKEIDLALGYEKELTKLCNMLNMIRAMLRDADGKKVKDSVMVWLKELKDVVGEADDVLDEMHYEMLRRAVEERDQEPRIDQDVVKLMMCWMWLVELMMSCVPTLKKFSFHREMGHKIEGINKKLEEINERASKLGLQNVGNSSVPESLHEDTHSYLDEGNIVGRESDARHIIELLTSSRKEEKLVIVPIVGMGGIGKTTLAKLVYNDRKIVEHFEKRFWVCVSVRVDINTLLAKIYESLTTKRSEVQTREILIQNLEKELKGKRYLLVLDDVWDEDKGHWEKFFECMKMVNSLNGSGILVTTRNLEIGTTYTTKDLYALGSLSEDECWSIFSESAFVPGRSPSRLLEDIGHAIVKKCCGLPLVVKVIGSMLRYYNNNEKRWSSIKDSTVWNLEGGDKVMSILKLSFDNLPNSIVKQCFAYCSIFEKDTIMERENLIQLWMALGLLQADETGNKDMEDVGDDILQSLVRNSLFQDVKMDEYGNIDHCKVHDLMHDLSLSLSRHESIGTTSVDVQGKHITVYQQEDSDELINISSKQGISMFFKKNMHTMFFTGEVYKNISFQHFKCLRILSFSGLTALETIHDSVGELVHLRYLDLSRTRINVLPKSICKLYHLQTLKLSNCSHLNELPEDISNLVSLRHFIGERRNNLNLAKVGQLTSLRTLSYFNVGRDPGYKIEELGHLKHLHGGLELYNLEEISSKEEAAKADLFGKKDLNSIRFQWGWERGANPNDKDVLEGLQPYRNIRSFNIDYFAGDDFPPWLKSMAVNIEGEWMPLMVLKSISITNCRNCLNLPMLGDLPFLEDLLLRNMDKVTCLSSFSSQGDDVIGSRKPLSSSLRSLSLECMKSLEWWTGATKNSSTFLSPVLEKLNIHECPKIILLDEHLCHPLVSLTISNCSNLKSIQSIEGLTSLEILNISDCDSLVGMPDMHKQGRSLKSLTLANCKSLTSFPRGIECLTCVNDVSLGLFSKNLPSFPSLQGIEKLSNNLHSLSLAGWDHWELIPEEVKHLTGLTSLSLSGFGIQEIPIWLTNMSSIRNVQFQWCGTLTESSFDRAPKEAELICFNGIVFGKQYYCFPPYYTYN